MQHVKLIKTLSIVLLLSCGMQVYAMERELERLLANNPALAQAIHLLDGRQAATQAVAPEPVVVQEATAPQGKVLSKRMIAIREAQAAAQVIAPEPVVVSEAGENSATKKASHDEGVKKWLKETREKIASEEYQAERAAMSAEERASLDERAKNWLKETREKIANEASLEQKAERAAISNGAAEPLVSQATANVEVEPVQMISASGSVNGKVSLSNTQIMNAIYAQDEQEVVREAQKNGLTEEKIAKLLEVRRIYFARAGKSDNPFLVNWPALSKAEKAANVEIISSVPKKRLSGTDKMKAIMAKDDATMIKQAQTNGLDEESIGKLLEIRHKSLEKKETTNQPKSILDAEDKGIAEWFGGEVKNEKEAHAAPQAVASAIVSEVVTAQKDAEFVGKKEEFKQSVWLQIEEFKQVVLQKIEEDLKKQVDQDVELEEVVLVAGFNLTATQQFQKNEKMRVIGTQIMKSIFIQDEPTVMDESSKIGLSHEVIAEILTLRRQLSSLWVDQVPRDWLQEIKKQIESEERWVIKVIPQEVAREAGAAGAPQPVIPGKSTKEKMAIAQERKAKARAEKAAKDAAAQEANSQAAAQVIAPEPVAESAPQKSEDQKLTPLAMLREAARKAKEKKLIEAQEGDQKKAEEVVLILADDLLQESESAPQETENLKLKALREKRAAAMAAQAPASDQQETVNPKLIALREERKEKSLSYMDKELQKYSKKKEKIDAGKETDQKLAEEAAAAPVARKNKRLEALMAGLDPKAVEQQKPEEAATIFAVAASQTHPEVLELELGSEFELVVEQQESVLQSDKIKGMEELARYDAAAQVPVIAKEQSTSAAIEEAESIDRDIDQAIEAIEAQHREIERFKREGAPSPVKALLTGNQKALEKAEGAAARARARLGIVHKPRPQIDWNKDSTDTIAEVPLTSAEVVQLDFETVQEPVAVQSEVENINEMGKLQRSVQEIGNQYPHLFKRAGATAQAIARLIDQQGADEVSQEESDLQVTEPAIASATSKRAPTTRMLALREQQEAFEGSSEEPRKLGRYQQAKEAAAAQAKEVAAAREAKLARPLVGPEVEAVCNMDEYKLIQGGWILATDASLPYKNEDLLLDNLASDDQGYLCDARSTRHLNCMVNQFSAGVVQKLKRHSFLDLETKKRLFTIDGINRILASQDPRIKKINSLFSVLAERNAQEKAPRLQPDDGAMKFLQTCVKAISQLQLLKVRMQTLQDNPGIRATKALDRLVHSMRLDPKKEPNSDDEYDDDYIFERTKKAIE